MQYLSGCLPSNPEMVAMLQDAGVGLMNQPNIGNSAESIRGWTWAADNGCFGSNWDPGRWVDYLERRRGEPGCLFAVVPDVVGDHLATVERWHEWWEIVAELGYRPAFVLQNGCTVASVPWGQCEAVFIGGDDTYKLSDTARTIVTEAKRRGVWVHMGRVNSYRRLRIAADMGCDSVDGTYLAFGPDVNTPRLVGWLKRLRTTPSLFIGETA